MMIEIRGEGGESILFDGASVAKFRHDGKEESARNPASTFREARVSPKKTKPSTIFSLTIPESEKPKLDELVMQLERLAAGS